MTARNAPRSILSPLSDVLTFATMAGLTVASAAAIVLFEALRKVGALDNPTAQ